MIQCDLPGLTITNEPGQTVPYLSDTNWYDAAEVVIDADDRPYGEGSFDVDIPQIRPRYFDVVIDLVDPGDGSAVWALHDVAMSLTELVDPFDVTFTDPARGPLSSVGVRVAGKVTFPIEDEDGVASVTIPLKARDPKRYGPLVVPTPKTGLPTGGGGVGYPITYPLDFGVPGNPGTIVLANTGNAAVVPDFQITGGLSGGFDLLAQETSAHKRFERLIPSDSVVTLRQSEGRAFIDGDNDVTRDLTYDEPIVVPPKSFVTVQFNAIGVATGTPTLTAINMRPAHR
ncbi:MAG: hypothetical protein AAGC66_04430 [Leifsonia sp.]